MVQTVSDSSRYFVIKPVDGPHLGLGFGDRSDSFDFNMALNEHFKSLRVEEEIAKEEEEPRERLDLAFKEGQTIKVRNYPLPVIMILIFLFHPRSTSTFLARITAREVNRQRPTRVLGSFPRPQQRPPPRVFFPLLRMRVVTPLR